MTSLLDVNVLVALTWRDHVLHDAATCWFAGVGAEGWATTTVTEAGLVRISTNPRVSDRAVSWTSALRMLDALRATPGHRWWPDDVDLAASEVVRRAPVVGHRQVTDVHLVALAAHHGGRLATLDRAVVDALHPDDRTMVIPIPAS